MKQEQPAKNQIEEIRHLLSHLHGEVTVLDASYHRLLLVLEKFEGTLQFEVATGVLSHESFLRKWGELLSSARALAQNSGVLSIGVDERYILQEVHGAKTLQEIRKKISQLLRRYESSRCIVGSGLQNSEGPDFLVALNGTDAEIMGAAEMIRRFTERLHGPIPTLSENTQSGHEKVQWKCTISLGMSSSRSEGYDPEQLLRASRQMLEIAFAQGGNQVRAG